MTGLWRQWLDVARLGLEAQHVIALRMMRMVSGDTRSKTEMRRMVTEKAAAVVASQMSAGAALVSGKSLRTAGKRAITPYRRRVRANRRRLSRAAK
jgi:hypothetical protein